MHFPIKKIYNKYSGYQSIRLKKLKLINMEPEKGGVVSIICNLNGSIQAKRKD